ncbi:helix-turn-helix transcriptional regulator [Waterburya agarophytonicola K14]|uniref:Helix-turn-helix transcriptional regulator n=1 Tax=Waterburya agarophytonicola KI4 TaxID=2874699 RepID=A0A964BSB0_9CYAN|nr:helix-turn-helix transcriptional regulator [Waterburya agarophytonicola]MCC0178545.1 helix-turn-helix transcriptional regulator [Waterburya agarophytonicola KI4]
MIQNQHQHQVTQNKLKDLEQSSIELEKIKDNLHPRQFLGRKNSLVEKIDAIRREIAEYEGLRQQQTSIKITSIQDLPLALIKARIALGMTQKELADLLGVKEQQVQRDEANQYNSAGFRRIAEVADALKIKIQETSILLLDRSI